MDTLVIVIVVIVVILLYFIGARRRAATTTATSPADASGRVYIDSNSVKLIVFHAPWCGHCHELIDGEASIWNILKRKYNGRTDVVISEVNCDEQPEIAEQYKITAFPTIMRFQGPNHTIFTGKRSVEALEKFINV